MTLYFGNISRHLEKETFSHICKEYGKCSIDWKNRFAYVTFDKDRNA